MSISVKAGQKMVKKTELIHAAQLHVICKASEEVYSSRVNLQACTLKTAAVTEA